MYDVERALAYHRDKRPGKITVNSSKPCRTQRDLSMAYTPGVAAPCLAIHKNPLDVYKYTTKGNLVAVISNGTAVLGLGNIGPLAGKPVMEGKGILFKRFADIDVFDIEVKTEDPEEFIHCVRLLEPTFGGINLEDIKAPECFIIEERLKAEMNIPVFHDDQHGTAIITGAALLNALEVTGRKIEDLKLVVSGAGAAGISCTNMYLKLGVRKENIIMLDIGGVIYKGRTEGMNKYMEKFAVDTKARTLEDALEGADMFLGVSAKGILKPEWLKRMNNEPIIFALANPDPEITAEDARKARPDALIATGRSDYPNQVNNVLGFPFVFRGALDVRASTINEEMKLAAAKALAQLAREEVPDCVARAYQGRRFHFGREYLIPTPFDPRVILWVAPAVAKAAIDSGVAQNHEFNLEAYPAHLETILGAERHLMRGLMNQARQAPKRIIFPEGDDDRVLRAVHLICEEGIAKPILLGNEEKIRARAKEIHADLCNAEVVDLCFPHDESRMDDRARRCLDAFFHLRSRKGITRNEALRRLSSNKNYQAALMVAMKEADGMVNGVTSRYRDAIRPALQVLQRREDVQIICGVYLMMLPNRTLIFADCTVNVNPTAEEVAQIGALAADLARFFGIEPRVGMLSFSNFGSSRHPNAEKMSLAAQILQEKRPDLVVDGEMMADTAITTEILQRDYPFSRLTRDANVLIFPNLESGNIAYKLVQGLSGGLAIGPLLMGIDKPFNVVNRHSDSETILYVTAITVCQAQGALMRPEK